MAECTLEVFLMKSDERGLEPDLTVYIDTDSWIEDEFEVDTDRDNLLSALRAASEDDDEGSIMERFPMWLYERELAAYTAERERQDRYDGLIIPCVVCGQAQCFQHDKERDALEIEPTKPTGFYGDGEPVHIFTPNDESFLSIDVQFVLWEDARGSFVVLRKADSYNGYGDATCYRVLGDDGTEPLDYASAYIACDGGTNPNPGQLALDGSKWEPCRAVWDHIPGHNGVDQGHGFGTLPGYRETGDYAVESGSEPKKGTLVIDEDERIAFCPVCGSGKLAAFKN